MRAAVKALLYPHYRQGAGPLSRERFKAVGKGAYDAAVERWAAGAVGGAALAAALCEGGALKAAVAAWLADRVAASLTSAERA